ncbi:dTDP-4-dehydrorhamnose 3,5-epimerase [candidate division WOR-3 bacterium]|nr:dTDP-4-dehydrorhamnose 3,5-epimerase [candidate division WOR-3 bacterium]
MNIKNLSIQGLMLFDLEKHDDKRGWFFEIFNETKLIKPNLQNIKQVNFSISYQNVIRGLHYQKPPRAQAKLIHVIEGIIFDVALDIRKSSPTFKQWKGVVLDHTKPQSLFIPEGFAHGFCVLSETAKVLYCVWDSYDKSCERGIKPTDPELKIQWPKGPHILSEKDESLPLFSEVKDFF